MCPHERFVSNVGVRAEPDDSFDNIGLNGLKMKCSSLDQSNPAEFVVKDDGYGEWKLLEDEIPMFY